MTNEDIDTPLTIIYDKTSAKDIFCAHVFDSLLNVKTDILPSEDAQARMAPSSCGAQDTEFTGFGVNPSFHPPEQGEMRT